jgi:hypothetical protein
VLFHHGRNPEYRIDTSRKFNQQCSPLSKKTVIFSSIRVVDVVGVSTSPNHPSTGAEQNPAVSQSIHRPPLAIDNQPTEKLKERRLLLLLLFVSVVPFSKKTTRPSGEKPNHNSRAHTDRDIFSTSYQPLPPAQTHKRKVKSAGWFSIKCEKSIHT